MTSTAPLLSLLGNYLKLVTNREQAISSNMANVDTPGYRTRDIDFQAEMKKVMSEALTPSANGTETAQMSPVLQEVQGLMERPDGNNVNIDREGLLMAETQLQYQMGVQLVKRQFHQILSAINGGGQ
jgi:flagellar basal-body rod protein FlgB